MDIQVCKGFNSEFEGKITNIFLDVSDLKEKQIKELIKQLIEFKKSCSK